MFFIGFFPDKDFGIVEERCENLICNDTLSRVPVTVTDSAGIIYRNMYCAACHNFGTPDLVYGLIR